jgi:hypothetical protein
MLVRVQRRLMLRIVGQRIQKHAVKTSCGWVSSPTRGIHERKPFLAVGMLHEVTHNRGRQGAKGDFVGVSGQPQPGKQHQIVEACHRLFDEGVVV